MSPAPGGDDSRQILQFHFLAAGGGGGAGDGVGRGGVGGASGGQSWSIASFMVAARRAAARRAKRAEHGCVGIGAGQERSGPRRPGPLWSAFVALHASPLSPALATPALAPSPPQGRHARLGPRLFWPATHRPCAPQSHHGRSRVGRSRHNVKGHPVPPGRLLQQSFQRALG